MINKNNKDNPLITAGNSLRTAGIIKNSIVDGPGIRFVIFTQGCPLKCEGCHNPHTHDENGGTLTNIEDIAKMIKSDPLLDGITLSGGEPFLQPTPLKNLIDLVAPLHTICYSGYTFAELLKKSDAAPLLSRIDILIDGRFELGEKSLSLNFRGSKNQKAINVKESLRLGKPIEIEI